MQNTLDQLLVDEENEVDVYQSIKKEFEKRIRTSSRVKLSVDRSLRDNAHCVVELWEDGYRASIEIMLMEISNKAYVDRWARRLVETLASAKYLIPQ